MIFEIYVKDLKDKKKNFMYINNTYSLEHTYFFSFFVGNLIIFFIFINI